MVFSTLISSCNNDQIRDRFELNRRRYAYLGSGRGNLRLCGEQRVERMTMENVALTTEKRVEKRLGLVGR